MPISEIIGVLTVIYIPIWSYFYGVGATVSVVALSFTFQYGATSTTVVDKLSDVINRFTFQYGATSTSTYLIMYF